MSVHLVSYDLRTPGKDYTRLHDHLKSYGTWAKPLESFWLIKTDLSAQELRDKVVGYMDANDKVFVVSVGAREAAWKNLPQDVVSWIQKNL